MVPSWMKCMFTLMTHVVFYFFNGFYINLLSLFPFSLRLLWVLVRRSDIKANWIPIRILHYVLYGWELGDMSFFLLSLCWVFLASPFGLCPPNLFILRLFFTLVGSLRLGLETFDTIFASGWEFNTPLSHTWC